MSTESKKITKSEEQMMDIFWSADEAMTSVDIVNMKVKDTWGNGLVHNIIRSLLQKGLLKECGIVRYKTQYARQLCPALTKEEYLAKMLLTKIDSKESRRKVLLAFVKEEENREEMIAELEEVIQQLRDMAQAK